MELGKLSAAYESNGDPAIVSTGEGDFGGISYGQQVIAEVQMRFLVGAYDKKMDFTKIMQEPFKVQGLLTPMSSLANGKNQGLWILTGL